MPARDKTKSIIHKDIDDIWTIHLKPSEIVLYEERAAILEFCEGLTPEAAAKISFYEIYNKKGE